MGRRRPLVLSSASRSGLTPLKRIGGIQPAQQLADEIDRARGEHGPVFAGSIPVPTTAPVPIPATILVTTPFAVPVPVLAAVRVLAGQRRACSSARSGWGSHTTASKPSWRASDCSAAGESARGLGGAVNHARSHSGSSVASMRAASLSSSTPITSPSARRPTTSGSEATSALTASGLCAPSSTVSGCSPTTCSRPGTSTWRRPHPKARSSSSTPAERRYSRAAARASAKLRR